MTEIAFHFNAPEKTAYACRLLRKAYLKGARVLVLAEPGAAEGLDQRLWTMGHVEFVPHCRADDAPGLKRASPIMICSGDLPEGFSANLLLNLTDGVPAGYERFERVIEVVALDEPDRARARERWRQYKASGLEPKRHDLKITRHES